MAIIIDILEQENHKVHKIAIKLDEKMRISLKNLPVMLEHYDQVRKEAPEILLTSDENEDRLEIIPPTSTHNETTELPSCDTHKTDRVDNNNSKATITPIGCEGEDMEEVRYREEIFN